MKRSDPAPQTTTVLWNLRNRQELRLAAYDARLGRTRADYGCGSAPESHRTFPGFDRACVHVFRYERILLFSYLVMPARAKHIYHARSSRRDEGIANS
jgi:hypothetical protein